MFFITYVGYPAATSPEWEESEGAYINAWVDEAIFEEADRLARRAINENRWVIESVEGWEEVDASTYANKSEGREYFEQALIDKQVYVYHTWPHGGDAKRTIH